MNTLLDNLTLSTKPTQNAASINFHIDACFSVLFFL